MTTIDIITSQLKMIEESRQVRILYALEWLRSPIVYQGLAESLRNLIPAFLTM